MIRMICIASLLALTGCNTVQGLGEDVSALGRGISHVADDFSNELRPPSHLRDREAQAGEPCDPAARELDGGPGLPACPS